MTYINKNKILSFAGIAVLTGMLVMPALTLAQTSAGNTNSFCASISNPDSPLNKQLAGIETKLSNASTQRVAQFQKNIDEKSAKRDTENGAIDAKRLAQYTKIKARAKTDAQTAAINAFITAYDAATLARRENTNAAEQTFISGVKSILAGSNSSIAGAANTLKTSLDSALAKAKTDCANGASDQTVHDAFKTSLKSAHDTFNATHGDSNAWKTEVSALHSTLIDTVKKAENTFEVSIQSAEKTLRAAFKK